MKSRFDIIEGTVGKMKPKAVIFDIDGTLANCDHRKHHIQKTPKDWDSFFNEMDKDTLNKDIYLLWLMCRDYRTFIITGRPIKYQKETHRWLDRHGISISPLGVVYREENDRRDDYIVKKEIYEKRKKMFPILLSGPPVFIGFFEYIKMRSSIDRETRKQINEFYKRRNMYQVHDYINSE